MVYRTAQRLGVMSLAVLLRQSPTHKAQVNTTHLCSAVPQLAGGPSPLRYSPPVRALPMVENPLLRGSKCTLVRQMELLTIFPSELQGLLRREEHHALLLLTPP